MNAIPPGERPVRTTCPYCGVGCGLLVTPDASAAVTVTGDPDHPANRGRICSKGAALGETIGLQGRLLHPLIRQGNGALARASWPTALDAVASGFQRIIERDGPDAVAFYLSGQLLTEDYYVANKLMKGFIGSANVDTNSRLCMASSVAGHRRAFGSDTVPGTYADLDEADLIVLVGSNAAWCHPVLFQRMVQNRQQRGAKIVVVDPRRTATCEEADLVLQIAPGADAVLFAGLLVHLADTHALDYRYIEAHTSGLENTLANARALAPDVAATARACGLKVADVNQFFDWYRTNERAVTCYSQGVNQSAQGTDKVNAIINCHLATGRIGKPGAGPFSLTGQPNAMGGREVGGLANQLAARMGFEAADVDRVRRFWRAPNIASREGPKAVQMFDAIAQGRIKALWVMATNPAVSLPQADGVREALGRLELFVVSDNVVSNDTINCGAHILLPAAAWGEKDGTVTNSERCISRQRAFLATPGDAKPDWWIVTEVARRLGFTEAFSYQSPADIFREHAALSAFENSGRRDFDIGGLAEVSGGEYDTLAPVQWPVTSKPSGGTSSEKRFFASGGFFTADHKARFVAPDKPALAQPTSPEFPLRLNTGRIRDQWHTMTRTGLSPRLATHMPEPFVEVHPRDAVAAGLRDGGFARVTTAHGSCVLKVIVSEGQRPGSLFAPIHWSAQTASSARVGGLVAPFTDPFSGQPEAKATPAAVSPVFLPLNGFIRSRVFLDQPPNTWWTRLATASGPEIRVASDRDVFAWHEHALSTLGRDAQVVEFVDPQERAYRIAAFVDGEFDGCLSVGTGASALRWDALRQVIAAGPPAESGVTTISLGDISACNADDGPIVCACFSTGLQTIAAAIASGATSVADISKATKAGSNCGSCLPEIKRIVARRRLAVTPG
jgi:assimilatory nitrate reductase catalytic subunit